MLLGLILLSQLISVKSSEIPQLEINDGKIQGSYLESGNGRKIFAFRGIPFAEPPIGPLRFKPPVPKKPWTDVLDATKPHAICPQIDIFLRDGKIMGIEDCLYLNVYTTRLTSRNIDPLPVMVFFHGGGFISGSGDYRHYSPETLLNQDIVLVIGNYRLGALGFLSTGDEVAPGNYGLKDQSLLLKWVNKNIKHFGGDPKNVTIFGESAGGASSNYHMFSPLSKGLFKGVISQSGSVFNFWAFNSVQENMKSAKILARKVNCPSSPSSDLVECLRNVDPLLLVASTIEIMASHADLFIPFAPTVESPSVDAFLIDKPVNLLEKGEFEDVPWIVGMTENEGLFKYFDFIENPSMVDDLSENLNKKAALWLNQYGFMKNIDAISEKMRKFYFGDEKIDEKKSFAEITNMYSDTYFTIGIDEAIRNYRKVSKNPVFMYVFKHDGPLSITSIMDSTNEFYGSCHADDLIYLFPNVQGYFPSRKITEDEEKFSKLITSLWINFAKTGDPTSVTNDVVKNRWFPVGTDKLEYYYISPEIHEMRTGVFEKRIKFWRNLLGNVAKDEL